MANVPPTLPDQSPSAVPCADKPPPQLHQGDNLPFLRRLANESIDLIYLDPPYNTGARKKGSAGAYPDSWPTMGDYVEFLALRIIEMHRALKSTGSILVHCDWRTDHHLRLLLDRVFGAERFINHLIWRYGLGGSSPRCFARKHDDILFYGKSVNYYFAVPMVPATSQRMKGQMKKATDILDIPALNNMANERTGYPTQKPLALLTLLVEACSPTGGVVADFFCGSGTTLVAAAKLGRDWIGCDQSADAITTTRQRLAGFK